MRPDEKYMKEAIKQAKKAYDLGEVPIGCIIVYQDKIIARGYNRRNTDKNTLSHAELIAINKASKKIGDWRLEGCILYVTLEPCPMCAGAILNSRIDRVVYGSQDSRFGGCGTTIDVLCGNALGQTVEVTHGVFGDECLGLIQGFFREMRAKKGDSGQKKL